MKIRPFIKPLYELLDSNDYVVRYYSYYYVIGKTPIQTSVYIQHIQEPIIQWFINAKDRTISKYSNSSVMHTRECTYTYNKYGRSKNKKLYPHEYDRLYEIICSYLIKEKLKKND